MLKSMQNVLFLALLFVLGAQAYVKRSCPWENGLWKQDVYDTTKCIGPRVNRYLHIGQCVANNNGWDVITRVAASPFSNTDACGNDPARHLVETKTFDLQDTITNWFLHYSVCVNKPELPRNYVTRVGFVAPAMTYTHNLCWDDTQRDWLRETPEQIWAVGGRGPRYIHWNVCGAPGMYNYITRITADDDPSDKNICEGARSPLEGSTFDVTAQEHEACECDDIYICSNDWRCCRGVFGTGCL